MPQISESRFAERHAEHGHTVEARSRHRSRHAPNRTLDVCGRSRSTDASSNYLSQPTLTLAAAVLAMSSPSEQRGVLAGPSRPASVLSTRSKTPPSIPSTTATVSSHAKEEPIPLSKHMAIQDQSTRLSFKRILVIYCGVGIALVVSFIDQTSVSTAAPVIGTDLGGSDSISWVGTAFYTRRAWLINQLRSTSGLWPAERYIRTETLLVSGLH
jgi:hypothetical protein